MGTLTRHGDQVDAAAALRAHGYRVTPQRLAIHAALAKRGHHLSAEELHAEVSKEMPALSLPTVYASLDALEEAGLARRVSAGRDRALYDAGPLHHHAVCRRCGAVQDLEAPLALIPAENAARATGFIPQGAEAVVYGLCARCAAEA